MIKCKNPDPHPAHEWLPHADASMQTGCPGKVGELFKVVEGLTVRPGDTLVFRLDSGIPEDQVQEFIDKANAHLPEGVKCLVVECEQMIKVPEQ